MSERGKALTFEEWGLEHHLHYDIQTVAERAWHARDAEIADLKKRLAELTERAIYAVDPCEAYGDQWGQFEGPYFVRKDSAIANIRAAALGEGEGHARENENI